MTHAPATAPYPSHREWIYVSRAGFSQPFSNAEGMERESPNCYIWSNFERAVNENRMF